MTTAHDEAGRARGHLPAGIGAGEGTRPQRRIEPIPDGAVPVMEAIGIS